MNKCEISVNGSTSDFQSEGDSSNLVISLQNMDGNRIRWCA